AMRPGRGSWTSPASESVFLKRCCRNVCNRVDRIEPAWRHARDYLRQTGAKLDNGWRPLCRLPESRLHLPPVVREPFLRNRTFATCASVYRIGLASFNQYPPAPRQRQPEATSIAL